MKRVMILVLLGSFFGGGGALAADLNVYTSTITNDPACRVFSERIIQHSEYSTLVERSCGESHNRHRNRTRDYPGVETVRTRAGYECTETNVRFNVDGAARSGVEFRCTDVPGDGPTRLIFDSETGYRVLAHTSEGLGFALRGLDESSIADSN